MTETRTLVLCSESGAFWALGAVPPGCAASEHEHQHFEVHRHLDAVVLPDGTAVTAASFDGADPYTRDRPPAFGLYLDAQWQPPWPHVHVDWPDFGVPDDPARVVAALQALLERARAGDVVEIGCLGGHGRTGTALACLATLNGVPAGDAVAWVRTTYCGDAVETPEQEAFVEALEPTPDPDA